MIAPALLVLGLSMLAAVCILAFALMSGVALRRSRKEEKSGDDRMKL